MFIVVKVTTVYMSLTDYRAKLCEKCGSYMIQHKTLIGYIKCHSCGYQKMENPIITLENYITSTNSHPELLNDPGYTQEIKDNAGKLLDKVNAFLHELGIKEAKVNSGWRSPTINAGIPNAAKSSNHLKALAIDLSDKNGELRKLMLDNLEMAKKYGIYFEDMRWTPTWVHMQIVAPMSGKRIYVPSAAPAIKPDAWSGTYDAKYN